MAYDEAAGTMVLFGGWPVRAGAQTWARPGTTWTLLAPLTSPSSRSGATMAYYPALGKIVLFGGESPGNVVLNDTWVYDRAAGPAGSCASVPFPDVPAVSSFCSDIEWLGEQHVTTGYADGRFHPSAPITRQAMAALLHRSAG